MALVPPGGSPWTLETLKVVVESEIASLGRVTDARFVAGDAAAAESKEAIKVGLAAAQTALSAAATLAKEAVTEAKAAHAAEHAALAMALSLAMLELKERLSEMNNFRAQIAQERADYVTRDRMAAAVTTLEGALSAAVVTLTTRTSLLETASQAWQKQQDGRITLLEKDMMPLQTQARHESRLTALENSKANLEGRLWALGIGLGLLIVATQFIFGNFVR